MTSEEKRLILRIYNMRKVGRISKKDLHDGLCFLIESDEGDIYVIETEKGESPLWVNVMGLNCPDIGMSNAPTFMTTKVIKKYEYIFFANGFGPLGCISPPEKIFILPKQ